MGSQIDLIKVKIVRGVTTEAVRLFVLDLQIEAEGKTDLEFRLGELADQIVRIIAQGFLLV